MKEVVFYTISLWLGKFIAWVPVNKLKKEGAFYFKHRYFYSHFLLPIANLYAKVKKIHFAFLIGKSWQNWEKKLYLLFYNMEVTIIGNNLKIPEIQGEVLSVFLQSCCSIDKKFLAIEKAIQTLYQLHTTAVIYPDGLSRKFSHGDAIADNVIYNLQNNSAYWFDFETMHSFNYHDRHTDDLRALVSSIAFYIDEKYFGRLIEILKQNYPKFPLKRLYVGIKASNSSYHLAQGNLTYRKKQHLLSALENVD